MKGKKLFNSFLITTFFMIITTCYVMADEIPEGIYLFRNYNSDLYMSCEGTNSGSNIKQMNWGNNEIVNTQKFKVTKDTTANGYYTIGLDNAVLKVVDVDGASKNDSANVQLYESNKTDAQRWKFISNNDSQGTYRIASKCSEDKKVITVSGALKDPGVNIFQYEYTSNPDGKWYMEALVDEDLYFIRNKTTGKYLTVSGNTVKQDTFNSNNYKNQLFKFTCDNNGYYDIAPFSDTNKSISVKGWDSGYDTEGTSISCEEGQSSEGQNWKFLLNGDGTYRIVSQISNCKRAITILNNYASNLYSYTYTNNKNANWELVKCYDMMYLKESKYFIVDFDTQKYLENKISKEAFYNWLMNLDLAYEGYAELVGDVPCNGKKIHIKDANKTTPGYDEVNVAYVFPNQEYIYINEKHLPNIITQIKILGDWSFGVLHELGHLFDINDDWQFHSELTANFKMTYLFYKYDGNISVYLNSRKLATKYDDIVEYYYSGASDAYTNTLGASNQRFHIDGLTSILLDLVDRDWGDMKKVYRAYSGMDVSVNKKSEKYNLFLDTMDKKLSKKNVKLRYNNLYSALHQFICNSVDENEGRRSIYEEENSNLCDYDLSGFIISN